MSKKTKWCQKPKISKPGCCLKLCEPIIWNLFFLQGFWPMCANGYRAPGPIHHEGKDDVVLGCCGMPSWLGALLATPPQNVCWGYPWELPTRERCDVLPSETIGKHHEAKAPLQPVNRLAARPQQLGDPKVFMAPNMTNPLISYFSQKQRIFFLNGNNAIIIQEDACFKQLYNYKHL